jgi:hypothetical protein
MSTFSAVGILCAFTAAVPSPQPTGHHRARIARPRDRTVFIRLGLIVFRFRTKRGEFVGHFGCNGERRLIAVDVETGDEGLQQ